MIAIASTGADALRLQAYNQLGVTPNAVARGVQITPQLKAIAAVIRRQGMPRVTRRIVESSSGVAINKNGQMKDVDVVEDTRHVPPYGPGSDVARSWPWYLEASDHDDARKILDAFYSIPSSRVRKLLPIEAFCHSASVSPLRALELITATCVRLGAQASTMIAAVNHPRVVEKTVEMALTDSGTEDRATLHKATGFLPTPKSAQTSISIVQNAQANANAAVASVPAPPPEQTIRRLVNRFNDARQLPEQSSAIPMPQMEGVEEAELVPVEIETEREDSEDD
jgi:hypothetical protein